jgi:hypothetical protein
MSPMTNLIAKINMNNNMNDINGNMNDKFDINATI